MRKFILLAPLILVAVCLFGFGSWMMIRALLIEGAKRNVATYLAEIPMAASDDDKVIALTKVIAVDFETRDPGSILLYRLRPIMTSHLLPEGIRLPDGVLASYRKAGLCDTAARLMKFALSQIGIKSEQLNIVMPNIGHTALLVFMPDGRSVMADPYFGLVTTKKDHLISPTEAQGLLRNGTPAKTVLFKIDGEKLPPLYSGFDRALFGQQDAPLTIPIALPDIPPSGLKIGDINQDAYDVRTGGETLGLTSFLNYMGHRFDRGWTRVLIPRAPVSIEMTLLEPARTGIITSTPAPRIAGNTLIWDHITPDHPLILEDGKATRSLLTLRSYIGVDQIILRPIAP